MSKNRLLLQAVLCIKRTARVRAVYWREKSGCGKHGESEACSALPPVVSPVTITLFTRALADHYTLYLPCLGRLCPSTHATRSSVCIKPYGINYSSLYIIKINFRLKNSNSNFSFSTSSNETYADSILFLPSSHRYKIELKLLTYKTIS